MLAVCDGTAGGGAGAGAGLQAGRRRRRRAQHRWHGRLLAGAGGRRRRRGHGDGPRPSSPRSPRCGPGGSTTGACSTPGSCSRPTARRCSSTTSASATPRPRSCCPASPATWRSCWPRAAAGRARRRAPTFDDDAAVTVVLRRRGLPRDVAARRRPDRGPRRGRGGRGRHRVLRRRRAPAPDGGAASPPAAGCSTSSAGARPGRRPASRAYAGRRPHPLARHAPPHRHRGGRPPVARPPRHREEHHDEGRRADGVAQRPGQDAAGRRHARARSASRPTCGSCPPTATRPQVVELVVARPARTATSPSSAARAWPPTWPASSPPTPRCPVVGVPLSGGALNGVDALYATVQMPKGIPVATVAIDGALNAALLVVEMLAISDEELAAAAGRRPASSGRPPDPVGSRQSPSERDDLGLRPSEETGLGPVRRRRSGRRLRPPHLGRVLEPSGSPGPRRGRCR